MKYSPSEIDQILQSLEIVIDTREQNTKALAKRIEGFGCPSVRQKLDYGDYCFTYIIPDGERALGDKIAVIERKMSLDELATNFTRERKRFQREFERAKNWGCKTHIIVENGSWEKLYAGSYRSKFSSKSFSASYLSWSQRYNTQLHFCKAETTPKLIRDICYYSLREYLLSC